MLNAEYTDDGETTQKFCTADNKLGITGALFSVDLDGSSYASCTEGRGYIYGEWPVDAQRLSSPGTDLKHSVSGRLP